jgi:hypothetical protein
MAGFRKAKGQQAFIKMALYGPQGSGKTFSSLLLAEGLALAMGKRVAYVDTETGTDFYSHANPGRSVHPEAFDFDTLEEEDGTRTRSLVAVLEALEGIDDNEYGVVVIDSITHLWEAAQEAYAGKRTRDGDLPFSAWAKIKKPYKALMRWMLGSRVHVIICGRQGNEYGVDSRGQPKVVGYKMKAEGETLYEPHVVLRLDHGLTAHVEKDRTGLLTGRTIDRPDFDSVCRPLLGLLGEVQAVPDSSEEAGSRDAEAHAEREANDESEGEKLRAHFRAQLTLAKTADDLKAIGKTITTDAKKKMGREATAQLKAYYQHRSTELERMT